MWALLLMGLLVILMFFTVVTFGIYQERKGVYLSNLYWFTMVGLGIFLVFIFFNFTKITDTQFSIFVGIHLGLMLSARILVGRESERKVDDSHRESLLESIDNKLRNYWR